MMKKQHSLLIILLPLLLITCRKDISVPDPELKKLFGKWEWVNGSCGWSGYSDPSTAGYTKTLEFKSDGVYIEYKNGVKEKRLNYKLESVNDNGTIHHLVRYSDRGLRKEDYPIPDELYLYGNDSLSLSGYQVADGCGYLYVRK